MVFINKELGNGFLIKTVDSSIDNEHWFTGAKKSLKVSVRPKFTTTEDITPSDVGSDFNSTVDIRIRNPDEWYFMDFRSLYRSRNQGDTWTALTRSSLSQEAYLGFDFSENYMYTIKASPGVSFGYVVHRTHFSSSMTGSAWVESEALLSGVLTADNQMATRWTANKIRCFSDDCVYVVGSVFSSSTPGGSGSHLARRTTNGSSACTWEMAYFSESLSNFLLGSVKEVLSSSTTGDVFFLGNWANEIMVEAIIVASSSTGISTVFYDETYPTGTAGAFRDIQGGVILPNGKIIIGCYGYQAGGGVDSASTACILTASVENYNQWNFRYHFAGETFGFDPATRPVYFDPSTDVIYYGQEIKNEVAYARSGSFCIFKSVDQGSTWSVYYMADHRTTPHYQLDSPSTIYAVTGSTLILATSYGSFAPLASRKKVEKIVVSDVLEFPCSIVATGTVYVRGTSYEAEVRSSKNNNLLYDESHISSYFGEIGSASLPREVQDAKFKITNLSAAFNSQDIRIFFQDDNEYSTPRNVLEFGSYFDLGNNVYEYRGRLSKPQFAYRNPHPIFKITSSLGDYKIYDFEMKFDQPLTDAGVRYYKQLDNQNLEFTYLRPNIFEGDNFLSKNKNEFPHSMGVFQMKNMIIGTQDSGRIGSTDDDLIQIKHFGSVVHVMWPSQANQDTLVAGFGDLAPGQRPGNLTTNFADGDYFDVADYDHVTLYCYLQKGVAGTLDNIDVKIKRRPLKSVGFATDNSIEYETSGSVTIAKLRDIYYRKEVDYSDLTEREIGFPIDVPLTNVKEIMISARQVTGQSAQENKNFLCWARFIKSAEET